jgi:adenylate cyclase
LFTALNGLARYYGMTGALETSLELAGKLLAIAEEAQDTALLLQAYRSMAGPLFQAGRIKEAQAWWRRGVAAYDPAQHEHDARRFGHDPAATFHSSLIQTLWLLGYPDKALAEERRLRRLICSWTHPTSLAYAHCFLAMGACLRRDAERARQEAEEAIGLGQAHGLPSWTAFAMVLQGWALVEQGCPEPGLAHIQEGATAWQARGFKHMVPFLLTLQAEACLQARRLDDAAAPLARARTIVEEGTDIFWRAEVYRLSGELLWQGEDGSADGGAASDGAEACFRDAVEVARRQEAKMLELRAGMSLARLLEARGRVKEARQLLAEIYGRFDEGFETAELQAAAALLGELA